MTYNPRDHYFRKAKQENFAARSIFKLEEIDKKYKLFKPGQLVLDLGASPGSWSQYASQKVGGKGKVLGVDLSPVTVSMANATFIQADLRDLNLEDIFREHGFEPPFDIVMSDMAPKTTGIRFTDQARSMELCELALDVARRFVKKDGHFICKLFHSDEFAKLRDEIKKSFVKCEAVKPDSTRKISKEIFLVGISRK
ncbi:cell division protein FtsJ [Bdellovibrio bacteriovorus W]|nr:cell division protein FtsJ [Bdellovibrio bacteriovorus W]